MSPVKVNARYTGFNQLFFHSTFFTQPHQTFFPATPAARFTSLIGGLCLLWSLGFVSILYLNLSMQTETRLSSSFTKL